jgi:hypothetical protein
VKFHEVAKPKVQLDHQIQGDTQQRSMNSGKSVSEGTKGRGHNISEARSYEELAHGHSPWSHKEKESSTGLALTRLVLPKPKRVELQGSKTCR